ncbi:NAD(P)H dehydrogenase (plasmid) [Sphingomonas paeninsulae]|uniref:NAD(P)H dehydrogenase n=1 Tax=Sphingomonas paeninsulae TaxID=2319844 RepID=A0A494TBL8_SPHPE|nr:NAD(P)H-dependent oxidoreductase [Sphingomonas paeninsulae]AYJ84583.1 NAD(P)H dehydrogenase [Sphingomonas paeninsulae]
MTLLISSTTQVGRHVVVLCHSDPDSFNRSIADTYCAAVSAAGQDVIFRDLYAMGFDPVLKASERPTIPGFQRSADVERELAMLSGSDIFVLIYPVWFGSPPAMMKGYVERVLGAGVDPEAIQRHDVSDLLGGKRLLSFTTSAATTIWLDEQGEVQALRDVFDRYLVAGFGMHSQKHMHLGHITSQLTDRFAHQDFYEVEEEAKRICEELALALAGDTNNRREAS